MADNTQIILSLCAAPASELGNILIKEGQMIFVYDKHRIALDLNGKRTFYNQIEELATEADREALLAPVVGQYYFVIGTGILWAYQNSGWIQLTGLSQELVFIGKELPELGAENKVYINTAAKEISVWDEESDSFVRVANETITTEISESEIDSLFAN